MSKFQIILFLFLAFTLFSCITSKLTSFDFLKVNSEYIKNNYGKGSNVYLRGTNIGNLFVQENWMSSTDSKDQKTTLETLTNRFGQDKALELLDYYESNYFTSSDLDLLKNLGISVLRIPFTYMNIYKKTGTDWTLRNDAFSRLDWIIDECSKRNIYVILDLHGAFGSQNGQDHSGEVIANIKDVTFFSNENLMQKTLDLWKNIALHYKGNPAIAAYDTLNEPGEKAGKTEKRHWDFYDRMYHTIREVDPDHIIIFESCWSPGNLPNPSLYGWENIIYEYHHYAWDYQDNNEASYTGQKKAFDSLVSSVKNAKYGVPTYIGEFTCFSNVNAWNYVLEKMNINGWHWSTWSFKSRGNGSWGIYHEKGYVKVNPASATETVIKTIWGPYGIATNPKDYGITYNALIKYLPGTIVPADKALTSKDFFAIKAGINGKYISADNYGHSNLVATKDEHKEWEEFRAIENNDGTISVISRANGYYLSTVFNDTDAENPLIAKSNKITNWEKFYVQQNNDGSYSLRTYEKNIYIQADIEDKTYGILHANGKSVGSWEKFSIIESNTNLRNLFQQQQNESSKFRNNYKIIAYYPRYHGDFSSKVNWQQLTHIYFAFGKPDGEAKGKMEDLSEYSKVINSMVTAAKKYEVIPILSVGGWSYGDRRCSEVFEENTDTDEKCLSFAKSIVDQADKYEFKGVDIDWEYPTKQSEKQFTSFMKYLRELCDEKKMTLTVAAPGERGEGFSNEVLKILDYVNVMAYDGDNGEGHSPYSYAVNSFTYWKDTMGVPAQKLTIGVPFYSRPSETVYSKIIEMDEENAMKDTIEIDGEINYYNGIPTMKKKAEFAAKNAGGIMIWEIYQDYSDEKNLSLLNAIYETTKEIMGKDEDEDEGK